MKTFLSRVWIDELAECFTTQSAAEVVDILNCILNKTITHYPVLRVEGTLLQKLNQKLKQKHSMMLNIKCLDEW